MDILEEVLVALQTEESVMLATIISTSGSTPASALSKMLVRSGGTVSVGTVGGGCMEGDVLLHANRLYRTGKAEILTFHLNEDDIESGLICGGSLDVLIEPVTQRQIPVIQELKTHRDDGEDCVLATLLEKDGRIRHKSLIKMNDKKMEHWSNGVMEELKGVRNSNIPQHRDSIVELVAKAHRRNETYRLKLPDEELIVEPVSGNPSLIIFGGGHVSRYVSRAAAMAGFRVTIIDDREKYANKVRFPESAHVLAIDFTDAFARIAIKPTTYIVIVTRGHQYDEDVLEQALKTPAKYIGMIGSKRKVLTTYEHLRGRGVSIEALNRVHAPIGIEIGAVTAEEIGVSIVAELIKVRRGQKLPPHHKSDETVKLIGESGN